MSPLRGKISYTRGQIKREKRFAFTFDTPMSRFEVRDQALRVQVPLAPDFGAFLETTVQWKPYEASNHCPYLFGYLQQDISMVMSKQFEKR